MVALVDDEDVPVANQYKWRAVRDRHSRAYYAVATTPIIDGHYSTIRLHRLVMDAPAGVSIDHINGDGLDNRKENLRVCSTAENSRNRTRIASHNKSGVTGVSYVKDRDKWLAQISVNGKHKFLGYHDTVEQAARVRRIAEHVYYKDFAPKREALCRNTN
jgi:hypothetical protein